MLTTSISSSLEVSFREPWPDESAYWNSHNDSQKSKKNGSFWATYLGLFSLKMSDFFNCIRKSTALFEAKSALFGVWRYGTFVVFNIKNLTRRKRLTLRWNTRLIGLKLRGDETSDWDWLAQAIVLRSSITRDSLLTCSKSYRKNFRKNILENLKNWKFPKKPYLA